MLFQSRNFATGHNFVWYFDMRSFEAQLYTNQKFGFKKSRMKQKGDKRDEPHHNFSRSREGTRF